MSDAWGGKAGSSSTFDPLVVRQLLKDLERDVSEMERFYAGMDISTMQRHQQNATTRQRAYDTTNRLRALLQLPPRSGTQNDKDQILSQAQGLFQRFTDLQRRTMDVDGQIVTQMRRSLSSPSGPSQDIVLGNQVVLKSVDINQEMLREYNEELSKATEGIKELEEIAREMQALTEEGGVKITAAEKATATTRNDVEAAVDDQQHASDYACQGRICCIIIIAVIVGILVVAALAIGLGVGLTRK